DRESVLADRKEVKTSSAWGETKFKISYVGNKIKLEADGAYRINETTSISQNCMYTYGKWDNLFHHFE
ncbi:MAG TPA: hypothetical protein VN132_09095, partial [Bdellovibrio sp.]|nr:hypothetical protein [Bdellovibrio sp.]